MGTQRTPGLRKRGSVWHYDTKVGGSRLWGSCRTGDLAEARRYLAKVLDDHRQATLYGVRPQRTWRQAATRYLQTEEKKSLATDARILLQLDPWIGELPLDQVHLETLGPWLNSMKGKQAGTINRYLAVVRRVLNLAARLWRDEYGLTWLESAPLIRQVKGPKRSAYPISWEEQDRLLPLLPDDLADAVLFALNTGLRNREICGLRWDRRAGEDFYLPETKNGEPRMVVLNSVARRIVERRKGRHPTHVFTDHRGRVRLDLSTTGWVKARSKAGLPLLRIHDLRHTFGRRLRAAGVCFEDRQDLLGHKSGRITTHYSRAEVEVLRAAAERVASRPADKTPTLMIVGRGAMR